MSDPIRLRDESNAARGLLDAARKPRPLPADVRARTAARVASMAAAPTVAATTGWKSLTLKTLGIAAFAAIGVGAGLTVWSWSHHGDRVRVEETTHATTPSTTPSTAPSTTPTPAPTPSPAPTLAPTPALAPMPAPSPTPSTTSSADTLAAETSLLDAARSKIDANPSAALAILDEHRAQFPNGKLSAEREYLSVRALLALGRRDEARARADAFLARWPESPLAPVVRDLVQ